MPLRNRWLVQVIHVQLYLYMFHTFWEFACSANSEPLYVNSQVGIGLKFRARDVGLQIQLAMDSGLQIFNYQHLILVHVHLQWEQ